MQRKGLFPREPKALALVQIEVAPVTGALQALFVPSRCDPENQRKPPEPRNIQSSSKVSRK